MNATRTTETIYFRYLVCVPNRNLFSYLLNGERESIKGATWRVKIKHFILSGDEIVHVCMWSL